MSNIPKLRFPEFKGEWEEKRLDSLSLINPKPGDLPEVFSYIDLESVKNGVLLQEKIIKKEEAPSRAQRLLEEKDILFQTVRPYQRNNYFFNSKSPTVASTGYAQFRVNKNNYPSFLYQYLYTNNFVKNVLDRCSGTSFPAISTNDLLEISLHIPSLAEQQKIADFLSNVDSIITAETKILNTLQKKKKALMQKLFTQQLRFKSDNGKDFPAWEEKKVIDFAKVDTGANNTQDKVEDGPYPFYVRSPIIYRSNKYIFDFPEAVLTVGDGVGTGKVFHYVQGKFDCHQRVYVIHDFENVLGKYFYFYFSEKFYARVKPMSAKNSVDSVRREMITDMKIPIPCKAEQQKIADCLSSLDSLIQTQQKVVTTWQQRKKALLQQMFV